LHCQLLSIPWHSLAHLADIGPFPFSVSSRFPSLLHRPARRTGRAAWLAGIDHRRHTGVTGIGDHRRAGRGTDCVRLRTGRVRLWTGRVRLRTGRRPTGPGAEAAPAEVIALPLVDRPRTFAARQSDRHNRYTHRKHATLHACDSCKVPTLSACETIHANWRSANARAYTPRCYTQVGR
jgi:hypothetical protein